MCKQQILIYIKIYSIYGHLCSSNILATPVYVMSAVDYSPTLSIVSPETSQFTVRQDLWSLLNCQHITDSVIKCCLASLTA